jgi:hypothetical protein
VKIVGFGVFLASLPLVVGTMVLVRSYKDHDENIRNGARWE